MLENLHPVRGQGWSLWGIITGFAYLLHLYRTWGISPPLLVLTTIDLYIHTISHPIWVSRGGLKKSWIESTKFIKNENLKAGAHVSRIKWYDLKIRTGCPRIVANANIGYEQKVIWHSI